MAVTPPAFKLGGQILPPYFVGRDAELQTLTHDAVKLSQHNVVMAPRRFGKTALLRAVQSRLSDRLLAVYVSCLAVTDSAVFHDRLVAGCLEAYETRHGKARRLRATWSDVLKKPVLGMMERLEELGGSLQHVGTVRLKFRTRELDEGDLLESAFDFLERFAREQGETVLLILDEFQALAPLGDHLFSMFKTKMDGQRRVAYLFSGSSLRLLREVFGQEGKSPLYQMVGRLFLGEIEPASVADFIRQRLGDVHGVAIEGTALERAVARVGGIPYYVQKLGLELERFILFGRRGPIDAEAVETAFATLLHELDADFQERWTTRFSDQQRAILRAVSGEPAASSAIANRLHVPPENLTYNLRQLRGAMILTKDDGRYRLTDRVFAAWVHRL